MHGERDARDGGDGGREGLQQLGLANIENLRRKVFPSSYTWVMPMPYVKGEMFSMLSSVASDGPTLPPPSTSPQIVVISMVPRAILVGTPRAWKNDVLPGSMPVLPAGIHTSMGATAPARAGAATCWPGSCRGFP